MSMKIVLPRSKCRGPKNAQRTVCTEYRRGSDHKQICEATQSGSVAKLAQFCLIIGCGLRNGVPLHDVYSVTYTCIV
jgi:hypothetical protein